MGCKLIVDSSYKCIPKIMEDSLDYVSIYDQRILVYLLVGEDEKTTLFIYNTESESEEAIIWNTKHCLCGISCSITQLPNGKLFCYGNYPASGVTLVIDENGGIRALSSGAFYDRSSSIYFNQNVYCFGGEIRENKKLNLSRRFNFNVSRWFDLPPMPYADYYCNSVIFNGNILISGAENRNLLLYSVFVNSFSTIPYEFSEYRRKILINAERRLYLIECNNGSIYESKIGSYIFWTKIADSTIDFNPNQAYSLYNKGKIYIGCAQSENVLYYKLDLKRYKNIALERLS